MYFQTNSVVSTAVIVSPTSSIMRNIASAHYTSPALPGIQSQTTTMHGGVHASRPKLLISFCSTAHGTRAISAQVHHVHTFNADQYVVAFDVQSSGQPRGVPPRVLYCIILCSVCVCMCDHSQSLCARLHEKAHSTDGAPLLLLPIFRALDSCITPPHFSQSRQ